MANPLEWVLKLVDRMSGPAKAASNALGGLDSKLKETNTASSAASKQSALTAEEMAGAMEAVAAAGAAVVVGAGLLAKAGESMAIDAVTFREQSEAGLSAILHSQTAAADVYEKTLTLADKIGLDKEAAIGAVKKLLNAGLSKDAAVQGLEAIANASQALGEGAGTAVENFLTTVAAKGQVSAASLNKLAKQGINLAGIYKNLAKQTGMTVEQVEALVKSGKADAAQVTAATLAAMKEQFGGVGEALGNTVPRLLGDLQGKFERLFDKVDLGPLKGALSAAGDALDGPIGAQMRGGINKIFGGLTDALFGALNPGRVAGLMSAMGDAFNIIGDIIVAIAPIAKAFIGGLIDGFIAAWPAIKAVGQVIAQAFQALGGSDTVIAAFRIFGEVLGFVVGAAVAVFGAVNALAGVFIGIFVGGIVGTVAAIGWLIETLGNLIGSVGDVLSSALDLGSSIIDGIVDGITSGLSSVVDAITGVATAAVDAAESALGISSPSKVFAKIGGHTVAGFAHGVANDNSGQDAVDAMIAPPSGLDAQQAGAAAASGGGGGGGGVVIHLGAINVNGASGEAGDIKAAVREALEEVGEEIRLAVGA